MSKPLTDQEHAAILNTLRQYDSGDLIDTIFENISEDRLRGFIPDED